MIVGNIINCNEEIDERYFKCLSIDEFISTDIREDHMKLPTLVVGWSTVKENFKDVSILSKVITPPKEGERGGIYWTFSKAEKRGIYEENLKEFKEKCYEDYIKKIKTYNIDPIVYNINTTEELCEKLSNLSGGVGYLFQGRIVYIYKENSIFMVDLDLIKFIGFDFGFILKFLMDNLSVFSEDLEEDFTEELKHLDIKYIPYLKYKNAT
tara:strand:+ start:4792 stop:5421 length:630 start_codon:yes stop_codon:yes gene_type:complete